MKAISTFFTFKSLILCLCIFLTSFQSEAQTYTLSGTVFEDVNYGGGAGRSLATSSGVVRASARVELYTSGGVYSTFTTTDGSGAFSFAGLANGTWYIRVVNSSVTSSRTGYTASCLPVETFKTDAPAGTANAVTDHVGGTTPSAADAANGSAGATFNTTTYVYSAVITGTAQSVARAVIGGANITSIDFGYSFNVVVNKNDAGRGSLRQFMINANALSNTGLAQSGLTSGIDNAVFMLADGTARAGMKAAYPTMFVTSIASVTVVTAYPIIIDPVSIDASLQPNYATVPVIELNGTSSVNTDGIKIDVGGSGSKIKGLSINRFDYAGISVGGADNCIIQSNHLGVDPTGAVARANGTYGILLDTDSDNNLVGGTSTATRNIISSNTSYGILVTSSDGNTISGNHIGCNLAGTGALANSTGVYLFNTSTNNTIGGTAAGSANIISGNTNYGITIYGSTGNTVLGNHIGTTLAGTGDLGNGFSGIFLSTNANDNTIGGTASGSRNVISGNVDGIEISSSTGTSILGNYIGLNAAGTAALANSAKGIRLQSSSNNSIIGGTAAGAGNVISGNGTFGISLDGVSGTTIQGNYVGINAAGTAAVPNLTYGIYIFNASPNNTIGGSAAGAGNVISGNGDAAASDVAFAIFGAGTTGNIVKGNFIGTNPAGTAAIANLGTGLWIGGGATNNIVGGTTAAERNIISGTSGATSYGVYLDNAATSYNTIQGNYIGLNAAGTAAISNGTYGVYLGAGANNNTIGGTAAGAGNVISGHTSYGVYITGSVANNNVLQGNYIGTNAAGTAAIANATGVWIGASSYSNTVGGTASGARNVISGNTNYNIILNGSTTNIVQGNYLGLNAAGTAALGTTWASVYIYNGATNNTVGGTTAAGRNIISGAANYGVYIVDAATTGNIIQGNYIGTDAAGTSAVANTVGGVYILTSSDNNTIGGTSAGAGNLIYGNGKGVIIAAACIGNGIISNSIYGNSGVGIDLTNDGVTANNGTKGAAIANYGMDHPVFTAATLSGTTLTVTGYIGTAPNDADFANATVQIFISDNDATGFGEGQIYLGSVTANASGNISASITVSGLSIGDKITATAYDATYNTSEFGANYTVTALTKTFTGTGNFSEAARWTGGTIPAAGDILIIDGTCTVDNSGTTDNVQYGTLTIGTATGRSISWAASGTNRLNVTNVAAGAGASTLNMTNGGTLIIRGTLTTANLTFTPGAGTIEIASTMTLPVAYATYNNLTVNGTGTTVTVGVNTTLNSNLTVTSGTFTVGAFSLAVTGTATITSTMTITSTTGAKSFGNLTINNGGTFTNNTVNAPITIAGNLANSGTFSQGTGAVTFTGAASNTITGSSTSAFGGGIVVNKGVSNANILDVQSLITLSAGGLTLTNGTFKLSSASTITPFTADITVSPFLIPATAGLWVNGGTVSITSEATNAGLIRVSNGILNVGDASDERLLSAWGTYNIEGGALNVAGRFVRRTSPEGHYFTMSGGTLTVPTVGSTSATYSPFTMDEVGSTFNMSGGTIVIPRSSAGNLGYKNTVSTYTVTGGTLQIGSASSPAGQTINIYASVPIHNLEINSSNVTATLVTNNFTVNNNATITAGTLSTNSLNLTVDGNFTNTASGVFTNNATLSVKGNITNDQASMVAGTSTTILNGTSAQTISGSQPFRTYNLNTNNAAGITLNNNLSVSGAHTFTAGDINSSVTPNYLIYEAGSSYSGDADNRHVNGWVKKIGSTDFSFPVGNGTVSRRMRIENLSGSLEFNGTFGTPTPNTGNIDASLILIDPNEYWTINRVSGSGSARVHLNWDNSKIDMPDYKLSAIRVASYIGGLWTDIGGSATGDVGTTGDITSNSVSSFGNFTLASNDFYLSLNFLSINAQRKDGHNLIQWKTANEVNTDRFEIERSNNGISFEKIGTVASENTSGIKNYSFNDYKVFGQTTWYRIKSLDKNAKSTYSAIISLRASGNSKSFYVVNNPVQGTIHIAAGDNFKGDYHYRLTNISGQSIQKGTVHISNNSTVSIELSANAKPGMYVLEVRNDVNVLRERIVVR